MSSGGLDYPIVRGLSEDGRTLLFSNQGESGGASYTVYMRNTDGVVTLGEGDACALSPDGHWALAVQYGSPQRLVLIPTGAGESVEPVLLPRGQIETYQDGAFLFDGRRIVFVGAERGRPQRTWVQEVSGGPPRPATPEGAVGITTSADGRSVVAVAHDRRLMIFPLGGGEPTSLGTINPRETVSQWSGDGRTVYLSRSGTTLEVFALDVESGFQHDCGRRSNCPTPPARGSGEYSSRGTRAAMPTAMCMSSRNCTWSRV